MEREEKEEPRRTKPRGRERERERVGGGGGENGREENQLLINFIPSNCFCWSTTDI